MNKLLLTFITLLSLQSFSFAADLITPEGWSAIMKSNVPVCKKLAELKNEGLYDPLDAKQMQSIIVPCTVSIASGASGASGK